MARIEVRGGPEPLVAAAIVAAVVRLEEERAAAAAVPPSRPTQGRWVLSGRPRDVTAAPTTRPAPATEGWSLSTSELDASDG